jgi:DNA-binding XRE family transcriptional regulator
VTIYGQGLFDVEIKSRQCGHIWPYPAFGQWRYGFSVDQDAAKLISDAVIQRLVGYRIKKRISQTRLAKLTGLSRTGIRHLESGNIHPTLYTLSKVSMALKVNLGRLVTEETRRIQNEKGHKAAQPHPDRD